MQTIIIVSCIWVFFAIINYRLAKAGYIQDNNTYTNFDMLQNVLLSIMAPFHMVSLHILIWCLSWLPNIIDWLDKEVTPSSSQPSPNSWDTLDTKCEMCRKNPSAPQHSCPFSEYLYGYRDSEECNCCPECEARCRNTEEA